MYFNGIANGTGAHFNAADPPEVQSTTPRRTRPCSSNPDKMLGALLLCAAIPSLALSSPTMPPLQPPGLPPIQPPAMPPFEPPSSPPLQPPVLPPYEPPSLPPYEPPAQPPHEPPAMPPYEPPSTPPYEPPAEPPSTPSSMAPSSPPSIVGVRRTPTPPPNPPTSPPPLPPAGPFHVVLAFTASGDVADYSTEVTGQIGDTLAGHEGVPTPESVSVEVKPGSVVITVTLSYEDEQSTQQARSALQPLIDEPDSLEAFLRDAGIILSVTELPPPSLTVDLTGDDVPSGEKPSEPRTSPAFWPLIITAIVIAVLLILLLALFMLYRRRMSNRASNGNDGFADKQAVGGRVAVRRTPPPARPSQDDSETSTYAETV